MRRRRRQRKQTSVKLNLAAMLDMAFQLLAFFILTFHPAPIEGYFELQLPPPVPLTKVRSETASPQQGNSEFSGIETLDVYIMADAQGDVAVLNVGERPIVKGRLDQEALNRFNGHLKSIFDAKELPFDRMQLAVDGRLRYEELMKIIDVCTQQILPDGKHLQRLSFMELGNQSTAP